MKFGIDRILNSDARNYFFTGKGGVGKTSISCAAALGFAERGESVLLVSTDPASNLDEVLGTTLGQEPTPVNGIPGLWGMNIDPAEAARAYREKMVASYRGILPEAAIRAVEEQLSGACTTEIAAFNEFSRLLGDADATYRFTRVVFDTAPTGHTLRLLELPGAWSGFLASSSGASCLGPLAGLQEMKSLYTSALSALRDGAKTLLVLVARPDGPPFAEASRSSAELSSLGIDNQYLVLNGIFKPSSDADPVAKVMADRQAEAIARMPENLSCLEHAQIPFMPGGVVGLDAVRGILSPIARSVAPPQATDEHLSLPPLSALVDTVERGGWGVFMTMGKGGVGKTHLAAHVASALAGRGHRVVFSTTDPAGCLQQWAGIPGLEVRPIDPKAEVAAYADEVMSAARPSMDDAGLKLLEEDLRSPCTEEIAVFRAFARTVEMGQDAFVVLDTAPTGHTLLLLDATEAYHRQVSHTMSNIPEAVRSLLPRLRDPRYTKVAIVTLPEATPVHEAAALQDDLERAGITPNCWIINQSLQPLSVKDPVLFAKRASEVRYIKEVQDTGLPCYMEPWR